LSGGGEVERGASAEHLEQVVEIGAEPLLLRALLPADGRAYSDFIARTDEQDLRRRFVPASAATEEDLVRYSQIDHHREMAFVAVRQRRRAGEEIVGEVRAYRYPAAPTVELAIMVRSDMKGRGLGRALMQKMIDCCRARGLEAIARIRPQNSAMIRLAQRCGMEVEHRPGSDLAIAHVGDNRGAARAATT
jgi:acetyltransferase